MTEHRTAERFRGEAETYVQAWEVTGPWSGTVYAQSIAIEMMSEGCDVQSTTIVRHDDGSREYLPGTVASHVYRYRYGWR